MTAFSNPEFIPAAIESVLDQDVASLELILVDDGSPEDIESVIAPYRDRLRYIRQENQGLGVARDTGIREARSEYIAFCDSDDLQYNYRLSAHLALLTAFPQAALVFSDLAKYEDGKVTAPSTLRERQLGIDEGDFDTSIRKAFGDPTDCAAGLDIDVPDEVSSRPVYVGRVPELIASRHIAWGGASMFRKSKILEVGGHDPNIRRFSDWSLVSRLSKTSDLVFWDTPVLHYRQHSSQLTQQGSAGGIRAYRDVVFSVWKDEPLLVNANPDLHKRLVVRACLTNAHYELKNRNYRKARIDLRECIKIAPLNRTGYTQMIRSLIRQYLLDPVRRVASP
jgi:glycosyltransferase involved in cell wall biosynthesis